MQAVSAELYRCANPACKKGVVVPTENIQGHRAHRCEGCSLRWWYEYCEPCRNWIDSREARGKCPKCGVRYCRRENCGICSPGRNEKRKGG